jgi:hypothetical protein
MKLKALEKPLRRSDEAFGAHKTIHFIPQKLLDAKKRVQLDEDAR